MPCDCYVYFILRLQSKRIKDYNILGSAVHNLGYINKKIYQYSTARDYFLEAIQYYNESSNNMLNSILELSQTLVKLGGDQEARKYAKKGIEIAHKSNHSMIYLIQLKLLCLDLEDDPHRIIKYIHETAIPYYKNSKNDALLIEVYEKLGSIYEGLNLYKNSSKFYSLALKKSRSINS